MEVSSSPSGRPMARTSCSPEIRLEESLRASRSSGTATWSSAPLEAMPCRSSGPTSSLRGRAGSPCHAEASAHRRREVTAGSWLPLAVATAATGEFAQEWDALADRSGAPPWFRAGWFGAWAQAYALLSQRPRRIDIVFADAAGSTAAALAELGPAAGYQVLSRTIERLCSYEFLGTDAPWK